MTTYVFLSPEWVEAAKRIRDEYLTSAPPPPFIMRMNVIVTETPFGDDRLSAYLDTSDGQLVLELGSIESPDLTVTVDYVTARRIFVDQDQNAAMEAFLTGRIVVDGDITKMLALQSQPLDPRASEIAQRISEITEH